MCQRACISSRCAAPGPGQQLPRSCPVLSYIKTVSGRSSHCRSHPECDPSSKIDRAAALAMIWKREKKAHCLQDEARWGADLINIPTTSPVPHYMRQVFRSAQHGGSVLFGERFGPRPFSGLIQSRQAMSSTCCAGKRTVKEGEALGVWDLQGRYTVRFQNASSYLQFCTH